MQMSDSADTRFPVREDFRKLYRCDRAERSVWLEMCRRCDQATFFHTPFWAELFERRFPGRFKAEPLMLRFEDHTGVVLPIVVKRHLMGLVRIVCSMPAGTFGGILSEHPLSPVREAAAVDCLLRFPNLVFRENPFQPLRHIPEHLHCIEDATQVVDIDKGYDGAWKRATAAHRNAVRNAVRSGVSVEEASTAEDWKAYVAIYNTSIERWKAKQQFSGVRYDEPFFMQIERLDASFRKLWLARVNGRPVAGILCFYWNRHAVVWHGSALATHFSFHPNNLLYDRAIAHAADAGYRCLDCNPSGTLRGVFKFKQYLGAQPMRSRVIVKRSGLLRMVQALRKMGGAV
jgi:hypothetical protein